MKTNEMKNRILALCGISALSILIIAFGLSIFKNKNVSTAEKAVKAYNYLQENTDLSSAQIIGIISNIKSQSLILLFIKLHLIWLVLCVGAMLELVN